MDIVVNEELKAYIDPLTPDEHEALERSLLAEGCRDKLILWGNVLVDGHNRYGICQKHGIPFQTMQHPRLKSIEDVHLWMIDQHLGRRSVSDFQRGLLALRKREILAERRERILAESKGKPLPAEDHPPAAAAEATLPPPQPLNNRAAVAKAARLSPTQVQMIEKITQQAAPEVVAAVRAGEITINAAAAVASLPAEEQKAAATAGKDELKQAAKRARSLGKPKEKPAPEVPEEAQAMGEDALRQRVAELTAENERLRERVADLQAALQRATAAA